MSLSTIPSSIEDPAFKKVIDQYELKCQELKSRNQKLLDHLQTREKEYQREYDVMKQKLESNKFTIRDLEDKNLDLKYQVSAFKKKEVDYQAQITKLKALVKSYQSQSEQVRASSRTSLPNMLRLSPDGQENTSTANSDSLYMSPPDASEPASRSPMLKRGSTVVLKLEEQMIEEEEEEETDRKAKNNHKIKSMTNLDSCHGTETESRSRLSVDCANKDLRSRVKRRWNIGEDLDNAISEESPSPKLAKEGKEHREKLSALKITLPSQEELPHISPLKKKRSSTRLLHIENTKFKSSMGVSDNPEYVDKFNKLTQNIVSLGVKPEIAHADGVLETVKSPIKTVEAVQSPDVTRKGSLLKYTNIVRKASLAMSPTSPIVRPWGSSTGQKVGRLFEDFFVIGASQEDLATFIRENPDKNKGNLQPKILFSYPSNSSCLDQPPRTSIPDFTFPFGVDVRQIKATPSFSGLNHIIYTSNDIEQRSKCFVFPLLSVNLEEDGPSLTLGQVIEASNPDHLFYIACISFKDFITMTDHSQKEKTLDKINYWEVNKTMCFMSYYPFTNLFFDILMKILNLLKVERMVKVSQMNEKDLARHEAVDMRFTNDYFETIVRKNLKNLLEAEVPNFDSQFSFKLQGGLTEAPIEFSLANSSLAHTFEASWACAMVFRYITYKDLLWFFTAILLERKLVFLSKNTHLLTATLFVLKSLIKPFKYPFPLIFNLPEVLMVYCDAPGAALIGINRGEEYLKEQNLFEDYPSCIYVCLDEQKLYMTPDNNVQQVQFSNFEKNLLTNYVKLNDKLKGAFVDAIKNPNVVPQQAVSKSTESAEERQKSLKILELFKETLEKKILAHIPVKAIKKPDQNLDYDEIGKVIVSKAKEVDKKFMREFVKTQIFIYYVEQHYEAATVKA